MVFGVATMLYFRCVSCCVSFSFFLFILAFNGLIKEHTQTQAHTHQKHKSEILWNYIWFNTRSYAAHHFIQYSFIMHIICRYCDGALLFFYFSLSNCVSLSFSNDSNANFSNSVAVGMLVNVWWLCALCDRTSSTTHIEGTIFPMREHHIRAATAHI